MFALNTDLDAENFINFIKKVNILSTEGKILKEFKN
jgi:hypothetical protein